VFIAASSSCDVHHFPAQHRFRQPKAAEHCVYVISANTVVKNVGGGIITYSNHELSQVAIGNPRDASSETSHNPAIFDQIFGIEGVNVVQPGFPFGSRASFLILTIQLQQDRQLNRAGGGKDAVRIMREISTVREIENGYTHHAIELGGDFFNSGRELFPK